MPSTQDPELTPPGASQGPFSKYLDPANPVVDSPAAPQRPSGFMGTTGKLAMFGSAILQGLQRGKLAAYARNEQQQYDQYAQAAAKVQALNQMPNVPPEVKAEAANYLTQSWATMTKAQIKEAKKNHADDGPGKKVLGFFEAIADKLGGPAPASHQFGGQKDQGGQTPIDKLNSLLSNVAVGQENPKYSLEGRFSQAQQGAESAIKQGGLRYYDDIAKDPIYRRFADVMEQANPQRYKAYEENLKEGYRRKKPAELQAELLDDIAKDQLPANQSGGAPIIAGTPGQGPSVVRPTLANSPIVEGEGASDKFQPFRMPDRTLIKSPEKERAYRALNGGRPEPPQQFKREVTNPDGTKKTEYKDALIYPLLPGYVVDATTGKRLDLEHWRRTTPGDKEPAATKPEKVKVERGGRMIEIHVDDKGQEIPDFKPIDLGPAKPVKVKGSGGGKPVDPLVEESRKQIIEGRNEKKHVGGLVSKIMADIDRDSKKYNMTPSQLLDQRIADFGEYYKDYPDIEQNYDAVHESLIKRKAQAAAMTRKEMDTTAARKKDQNLGLLPKDVKPVVSPPAPSKPHKIQIGGKFYQYKGKGDTADLSNYTEVGN